MFKTKYLTGVVLVLFVALAIVGTVRSGQGGMGGQAPDVFEITKLQINTDGTAELEWVGASDGIVVEINPTLDPANWSPVPSTDNHWPISGTSWTGNLPAGQSSGFLRVRQDEGPFTAVVPFSTITLDLIGIHDSDSTSYNANCIGCHGDRSNEVALDGQTLTAHSKHLQLFGQGNNRCVFCHETGPDFVTYSSGGLRESVNLQARSCNVCHGLGKGALEFYAH